jgi:hypothetical protein
VVQNNVSGNEVWQVSQGPGGQGGAFSINLSRNGTGFGIFCGTQQTINGVANGCTAAAGTGAATTQATTAISTYYWHGTAPTSWTITTPTTPFDGEIISVASDTALTGAVTITPATGQVMGSGAISGATVGSKGSLEMQYNFATSSWWQLR